MTDVELVYVADGCDRYHTSRECQGLSHARDVTEQPLSSLPDDLSHCKLCSGSYQHPPADGPLVTARLLEDLEPDDIG